MYIKDYSTRLPLAFSKGFHFFAEGEGDGGDGNGGGDGTGSGGSGDGSTGSGQDKGKTFTQAELDAIVQERLSRANTSAAEKMAKELGMTVAEAKTALAEAKKLRDANKSAEERAAEAAAEREKAAAEREAAAELKEFNAEVKVALMAADADKARIERIKGLLTVKPGATDEEIAADVKALKKDFPELFKKPGAANTDPGRGAGGQGGGKDSFTAGMESAKANSAGKNETPALFKGIL